MQHGVNLYKRILLLISLLTGFTVNASDEDVIAYLTDLGIKVEAINENPILENITLKTALTSSGIVYFDEKKNIFFAKTKPLYKVGQQLDVVDKQFFAEYIQQIPNTIDAKSPSEKMIAYVFTDISCSHCQKFHANLNAYLESGITIKFLQFPRNGLKGAVAGQMSAISQAPNKLQALQNAFNGQYIEPLPITQDLEQHFNAALGLGITSTPTVIVNGYVFEGYLQPKQILSMQSK